MKLYTIKLIAALFLIAAVFQQGSHAQVSGSNADVPRTMSYQGVVTTNGTPMNGTHKITATIYSDRFGTRSVWSGDYNAEITNGVFNILLGSGASPLPQVSSLNRPLWVGVRVDGGEEMKPLTQLAGVPYALNIPDQSVTMSKLSPDVASHISTFGNPKPQTANSTNYWSEKGNTGTSPGTNYAGTSDSTAFEIHVNDSDATPNRGSKRVMRYEPNATSPNILGGYQGNRFTGKVIGSVIAGGGNSSQINEIRTIYSSVLGGNGNLIDSNSQNSAIVAGVTNKIMPGATHSYIGAGSGGKIDTGATGSVIIGGSVNYISDSCQNGLIGSGSYNVIRGKAQNVTIPGGDSLIGQSYAQTIVGHYNALQTVTSPNVSVDTLDVLTIGNGSAGNRSNAFQVFNNGTSIVHHNNGKTHGAITGGTYMDNVVYAWGHISLGNTYWFGVSSVNVVGSTATIGLNLINPDGTATYLNDQDAAVVVTPYGNSDPCVYTQVSGLSNNGGTATTFNVSFYESNIHPPDISHASYWLSCDARTSISDFMFIVVGRPHQ